MPSLSSQLFFSAGGKLVVGRFRAEDNWEVYLRAVRQPRTRRAVPWKVSNANLGQLPAVVADHN